jgi:hypothetical protein
MHPTSTSTLSIVLRTDAAGCAVLGVVGLLTAVPIAGALGLAGATPVRVVAALFLLYAVELVLVARRPTPRRVGALIAADVIFGGGLLVFVLVDPTGAEAGARWAGAALADMSLVFAVLKGWALRRALTDAARQAAPATAMTR